MGELRTMRGDDGQQYYSESLVLDRVGFIAFVGVVGALVGAFGCYLFLATVPPPAAPLSPGEAYGVTRLNPTPPIQFTGGVEVRVRFTTPEEIATLCGRDAAACWDFERERIVIDNPCYNGLENERAQRSQQWMSGYQQRMCHEMGHVNGWLHETINERNARIAAARTE